MVSNSTADRADLERDDKKLRRKARSSLLSSPSIQSEARLAAQHAAQWVGMHENIQPSDLSVASEPSALSTERAIRRGSQRALIDNSRHEGSRGHSRSVADFDLTTVTEDATLPTHQTNSEGKPKIVKKRKKSWRIVRISRKGSSRKGRFASRKGSVKSHGSAGSSSNQSVLEMATPHDAWMCGVCGKVFSTYKSAEVHEELCIREKMAKFGLIETAVPMEANDPTTPNQSNVACAPQHVVDTSIVARVPFDESDRASSFQSAVSSQRSVDAFYLRKSVDFADLHPVESLEATGVKGRAFGRPILRHPVSPVPFPELAALDHNGRKQDMEKNFRNSNMASKTSLQRSTVPEWKDMDDDLLLPETIRRYVVLSDEALVNAVLHATPLTLSKQEIDAEFELRLLALDKAYYDAMAGRSARRKRFRIEKLTGTGVIAKLQNKFVDAYQLIKEGEAEGEMSTDQYTRKKKGGVSGGGDIVHSDDTFYVNVIVKQSILVVSNELDRLAKIRWEETQRKTRLESADEKTARFERFRAFAITHAVKLAGLALASDFTPRRIAVQLSNDLYRLMAPQLKPRGVSVEAEIEYRVGPYFIIAVNVLSVNWVMFMRFSNKDHLDRNKKWAQERSRREKLQQGTAEEGKAADAEEEPSKLKHTVQYIQRLRQLTLFDVIANSLAWLHHLPWIVSVPICWSMYHVFLRAMMRRYIIYTVTDDIFSYVNSKGMEMEMAVKHSRNQAAFMLAALRELREDSRELKKKRKETQAADKGVILGPLLGPAIKSDKGPACPPPNFVPPENLETVGLEIDLPIGFKRLRWGLLNSQCRFVLDALFTAECKNTDITFGDWCHHNDTIGLSVLPDGVKPEDFIGAERELSYMMPKSAFVNANMAYETHIITEYSDHCFCLKKKTRNPDVPFGSTFIAWTQVVVTNTGNDSCRMVCSVEAEFPNGPPMVGGQIKSGMRAGTAQFFVLMGETICKYADEYP